MIDAVPAEAAEGAVDGGGGLALFFALSVLDGGGGAEAAVAIDADDGGVAFQIDPVTPGLGLVARLEMFFFQRGEDIADSAGRLVFWELDDGFHGRKGRSG